MPHNGRPRSQAPFRRHRHERPGSREPYRVVTWVAVDRYVVDGVPEDFEDPVDAIKIAESIGAVAYRKSDGRPLNFYGSLYDEAAR